MPNAKIFEEMLKAKVNANVTQAAGVESSCYMAVSGVNRQSKRLGRLDWFIDRLIAVLSPVPRDSHGQVMDVPETKQK